MMDAWRAERIKFIDSRCLHNLKATERKQGLEVQVLKFLPAKCCLGLGSGLSS